jgi:hypothetical protein
MKTLKFFLPLIYLLFFQVAVQAQKFTRMNYFDFLPPTPKIICQTGASDSLHLYGNPEDSDYQDIYPIDGIDDHRARRLDSLAAMFSPVIRKNNFSTPQDFERMLKIRYDKEKNEPTEDGEAYLFVDTWDLTKPSSELVKSDTIRLGYAELAIDDSSDYELKRLLFEFHPDSLKIQKIAPDSHFQKLLFFDFPGENEKSWKKIYKNVTEKKSKIYAHFFIHEETEAKGLARFELVIQYWFFYPFNDGANNHEGDWEHINVRITTLDRKGELLTAQDLQRILDHTNKQILDSLIVKKVDYYFHHFVTTLDYQAVDFLQDRKSFMESLRGLEQEKMLQNWINEQIYNRIHLVKDSLNTHPICYIGADNMGLDQVLAFPGGTNRNPHGTYPFLGIWKRIGPAGATEKVNGEKNYKFILPPIDKPKFISRIDDKKPEYKPEKNLNYVTYSRGDIILVPDWERVIDSTLTNPEVRRKWFWLILPIRWGFPAVESPGAGILKHTDMGNIAPVGPAYNGGWNRVGATRGYEPYNPHVFPKQFLFGLQDNFKNEWGFLNLTLPTIISLPVTNLIWSMTFANFEFKPKFFSRNQLPFRFASLVYRPFYTIGDDKFAHLLPGEANLAINSFLSNGSGAFIDTKSFKHENYTSFGSFMFNINFGRYASENTFSISNSKVRYNIRDKEERSVGLVEGNLKFYEFYGSLKHCFFKSNIQPFIRTGYGWSFYRVEKMTLNGEPFKPVKTQWFHNTILPKSGHVGAGFELFAKRNYSIMQKRFLEQIFYVGQPEFGLRLEYTFHFHKLGKDAPVNAWVYRHELGVGLVVSF